MEQESGITVISAKPVHRPSIMGPMEGPIMGPMAAGNINVTGNQGNGRDPTGTGSHECMFAICLLFFGIVILIAGFILYNFYYIVGILVLAIGGMVTFSGSCIGIIGIYWQLKHWKKQ